MALKIINGRFSRSKGKPKKDTQEIHDLRKAYFEALYRRFGYLQPDREKFMELAVKLKKY